MKNKFILFIFGMIFLIGIMGFVKAECTSELPPLKQGTSVQLTQVCSNCTYVNLTKIVYPNQSFALLGEYSMIKNGTNFYYSFDVPETIGAYYYSTKGDLNGVVETQDTCFTATYYGNQISTSQSIIYVALLVIMILIFVGVFFGIGLLPDQDARDEEGRLVKISWLKYLRPALWFVEYMIFIAIMYLSSNLAFAYLGEQLFAKTLFMIYRILFVMAPVILIVWIIWIFSKMFHDKEMQRILNRGIFPEGKRR